MKQLSASPVNAALQKARSEKRTVKSSKLSAGTPNYENLSDFSVNGYDSVHFDLTEDSGGNSALWVFWRGGILTNPNSSILRAVWIPVNLWSRHMTWKFCQNQKHVYRVRQYTVFTWLHTYPTASPYQGHYPQRSYSVSFLRWCLPCIIEEK